MWGFQVNSGIEFSSPVVTDAFVEDYSKKSWGGGGYDTPGVNTGALLQALRTNAPGALSDNRLAQSQRFIDVVYVAISARCNAMASCTVEINDMAHPEEDFGGPQVNKGWNGRDPQAPRGSAADPSNYEFDGLLEHRIKSALSHQPHIQPKGEPVEYDHDLYKLIENPNHEDTMADFLYEFLMQLDLTGSTLVWKVPNHLGACQEMYVIPTALAQPMPYSARFPRGAWRITPLYAYGPYAVLPSGIGTSGAVVPADQIVRCKRKHPFLRWDGYSKLTGMSVGIDLLKQVDLARWNAMLDGIYPSGVFSIDVTKGGPKLNQAALDAFETKLIQKFASARNFGRFMIPPPGVEFNPTANPPINMAFESGWEQIANFVMSGLGIPATVISGTAAGNYAELYARMKQYYLLDLMPDVRKISAWYTKHVATDWSDTLRVNLHLPTLDDPQLFENQLSQDDQIGIRTKDERRKIRGLEPWGGEIGRQIVGGPENLADAKAEAALAKADKDESVSPSKEEDTEADVLTSDRSEPTQKEKRTIVTSQNNGDGKADVNKHRTAIPNHKQGKGSLPSKVLPVRKSWEGNGHPTTLREDILRGLNADASEKPHKFGTTHFELPAEVCALASQMAQAIPDHELADDGRCKSDFHITAKYGIHTGDPAEVMSAVDGFGPVTVRLGLVSIFPATAEHPYDVVKVDVESGQLRALNRLISNSLACTDTHPTYSPHMTLAAVLPGDGQKYVGDDSLLGLKITFTTLMFSDQDGNTHSIELDTAESPMRVPMLAGSAAGQPEGMKGHWFTSKQGHPFYSEHGSGDSNGGGKGKEDQPPPTKESWKKDHPKLSKEIEEKEGKKEGGNEPKKEDRQSPDAATDSTAKEPVAKEQKPDENPTETLETKPNAATESQPDAAKPEEKPAEPDTAEATTETENNLNADAAKEEEKPKELSTGEKKLQQEALSRFNGYFKPKQLEKLEGFAESKVRSGMRGKVDTEAAVSDALLTYRKNLEAGKVIPKDADHERAILNNMIWNQVQNAIRDAKAAKRDAGREVSAGRDEDSESPVDSVADSGNDQKRYDDAEEVQAFVQQLSVEDEDAGEVFEQFHLDGKMVKDIAAERGTNTKDIQRKLRDIEGKMRDWLQRHERASGADDGSRWL